MLNAYITLCIYFEILVFISDSIKLSIHELIKTSRLCWYNLSLVSYAIFQHENKAEHIFSYTCTTITVIIGKMCNTDLF